MEKPTDLEPNRFIKVLYESPEGLRCTVAWTYEQYTQTWLQAIKLQYTFVGVDAVYITKKYSSKIDWNKVVNWDYVKFDELKPPKDYKVDETNL